MSQELISRCANGLDRATLVELFRWSEPSSTSACGLADPRIGHERWLRNLAVGWGTRLVAEVYKR
jgi:epoxyqueuosine reductase QueG